MPHLSISQARCRNYLNPGWLARHLDDYRISPQDTQATLSALTTGSIAHAIRRYAPRTQRLLVCGGGAHNRQLMKTLETALAPIRVESTLLHGVDPDWVEAAAFAWLARQNIAGKPGNIPEVTGARQPVILGNLFRTKAA